MPFDAEDMAFDADGRIYLRTHDLVVRYEMPTWREIPFDYGREQKGVGTSASNDGRRTDVVSGLPLYNGTGWHKGGMYVNVKGDILASCLVTKGRCDAISGTSDGRKDGRQEPQVALLHPADFPRPVTVRRASRLGPAWQADP